MVRPVVGRWRILEMDLWDDDAIDLLGPGYFEVGADGRGSFRFIAVEGDIDARRAERDGRLGVEFSWVGDDDGDEVSGRGWAAVQDDGILRCHIYVHGGDDSGFRAAGFKVAEQPRARRTTPAS
jgi:hypothetical protein